jgi:CO/xanthine dehydrogenase Mo-binding subunit
MSDRYRFIGKPTPRSDAVEIVTGKADFIDDLRLPDMLYGKVLRSPYPHASIKAIDTTRAGSMPGVKAVLTYKNVPDWMGGTPPHVRVLDRKVRFVGDAVALIAAESEQIAEAALELVAVDYEPLQAVYDVEEAVKPDAPQLYEQFPGNLIPAVFPAYGPKSLKELALGDVEKGFKEADFISEGTYGYERVPNPLPIEPPGVIARWEGPDRVTIWSAIQSASWHRFVMLSMMGFPEIRSISTHCGGSFGSKNYALMPCFYAAALAKETGRPVKVYYSKEEHFGAFALRLGARFKGKVGIKRDGTVTALSGELLVDTGAFSDMAQAQVAVGYGEVQLMLRCPNWSLRTRLVCTNRNPSGAVRGFGGQELESALLPVLIDAMRQADLDPVEFFKKNYVKPGDGYFWRDGKWYVSRGLDYAKAIERGAKTFGWEEKWKGWLRPTAVNGSKRIGVGVGVHGNADVGEDVSEAYVRLTPDARVTIHTCVSESGMGQRNSLCKMVAEVLQVPMERVSVTPADTLVNPFEFGLVGSRGTYALGSAVIAAAEDAKQDLLKRAAPLFEASPEELETQDGRVYVKRRPEKRLSWSRVIGIARTCTGFGRFEPDFTVPNFIILFVEVEVDVETGKVDLVQVVPATDVGQIIDPLALRGQLHGCLGSAGLDTALFEETVLDRSTGRIVNMNMVDYKWRTFRELPRFQNVVLETPISTHRFKAIGVGEITTSPGPGAILMAVSNAVGVRLTEYPLTPDKVLRAIGKTGA